MPAHKRKIERRCQWTEPPGCARIADWEVFNTWNGSMGYFCNQHANLRVDALNEMDRQVKQWSASGQGGM